jgi:uncharacterized integral membrane protein
MSTDPDVPSTDAEPADVKEPTDVKKVDEPEPQAKTVEKPKPPPPEDAVKFTRAAALWSSLIVGLLVLVVLLVFITQNTEPADMTFLSWHWSMPLGVQILLAAILGSMLTVLVGAARIVQLRRAARKNYKAALR